MRGIITKYDDGRKFGFIRPQSGKENDLFFHISDVNGDDDSLIKAGTSVTYTLGKGDKGPKAIDITVVRLAVNPYKFFAAAAIFMTVVLYVGFQFALPDLHPALKYLLAINFSLFVLTGFDKSIAGGGTTRVPEYISYIFAAAGGSLGILVGMNAFRHKIKKPNFAFVVALILCAQLVAWRLITR